MRTCSAPRTPSPCGSSRCSADHGREHRATLRDGATFSHAVRGGLDTLSSSARSTRRSPDLGQRLVGATDHLGEDPNAGAGLSASGLTSRCGIDRKNERLEKFVVGQGIGRRCRGTGAQAGRDGRDNAASGFASAAVGNGAERGALVAGAGRSADYGAGYGGGSRCRRRQGEDLTPVSVTPSACSNCADSERSRVTAVHRRRAPSRAAPKVDHRLDGEDHARLQVMPSPGRRRG